MGLKIPDPGSCGPEFLWKVEPAWLAQGFTANQWLQPALGTGFSAGINLNNSMMLIFWSNSC